MTSIMELEAAGIRGLHRPTEHEVPCGLDSFPIATGRMRRPWHADRPEI
jgi:hypothetical protein